MLNQVIVVGRLVRNPELYETNDSKMTRITLAIPRSYKNVEGIYETDFIECTLWKGIAENAIEYCKKGDLVGIRGRLQSSVYEKEEKKCYKTDVVAERITFLSSKKEEKEKQIQKEKEDFNELEAE